MHSALKAGQQFFDGVVGFTVGVGTTGVVGFGSDSHPGIIPIATPSHTSATDSPVVHAKH